MEKNLDLWTVTNANAMSSETAVGEHQGYCVRKCA